MKRELPQLDAQLNAWSDFVRYLNAGAFTLLSIVVSDPAIELANKARPITREYYYSYKTAIRQCYAHYLAALREAETDPQWVVSFAREVKAQDTPMAVSYRVVAAEKLGVEL